MKNVSLTRVTTVLATSLFLFLACFGITEAAPHETVIPADSIKELDITIYNNDLALVKDVRSVKLPSGINSLAYSGISAKIKPETAIFDVKGMNVLEQNFEFDLLTPASILKKYTGHTVEIIKQHPTTGEETVEKAEVLATSSGVVLKIGNRIETSIPGRIAFPDVPEDLRVHPTLCLLADIDRKGPKEIDLTYLTTGLGWHADYVASLDKKENALELKGWVTLTNNSGTTYKDATLQLVAGDVNRVRGPRPNRTMYLEKSVAMAAPSDAMREEGIMDYHLYTLGRKTTLGNRQTKQISLLSAASVPCVKEYITEGSQGFFTRRNNGATKLNTGVFLNLLNTKENHLGMPMPKGVVRVYKADSRGSLQFVGEDRIDHTPENEKIRLKLGNAFDITAWKKQTDFKKLSGFSQYNYVYESAFEVEIKNAKADDVTVKVRENMPGDWKVKSENMKHKKLSSTLAEWSVRVPAKGRVKLEYRVVVKY